MERNRKNALWWAAGGAALLAAGALWQSRRAMDLRGRIVLITGGSRGLGLVLAREFGARGARLVICARDPEELERAREGLARRGVEVFPVRCDVSDPDQIQQLVETVISRYGCLDVLVNNAGVIQVGPLEVQTVADFEEAMRIHFWGPLHLTRAVLPCMKQQGEGRIVNVSSIGGKVSVPHMLPYSASKFALVGLSEGLRAELKKDGILVTTVVPATMRTGSPRNAFFKGDHHAEYTWFALSDSLPGASVPAERAARQIVAATRRGDPELIIGWWPELAVRFHGLFPGATSDLMALMNRALPEPDDAGTERYLGSESETPLTRSSITRLTQQAAAKNNQL